MPTVISGVMTARTASLCGSPKLATAGVHGFTEPKNIVIGHVNDDRPLLGLRYPQGCLGPPGSLFSFDWASPMASGVRRTLHA